MLNSWNILSTMSYLFQTGIAVKKMEEMDAKAEKVHLVSKVHLEL